jgi:hypothetical protein
VLILPLRVNIFSIKHTRVIFTQLLHMLVRQIPYVSLGQSAANVHSQIKQADRKPVGESCAELS